MPTSNAIAFDVYTKNNVGSALHRFTLHASAMPQKAQWTNTNTKLNEVKGLPIHPVNFDQQKYVTNLPKAGKLTFAPVHPGIFASHGLSLTSKGVLTGTLKNADDGAYTFGIAAKNAAGTADRKFTIHLQKNVLPKWSKIKVITVKQGEPVNVNFDKKAYITNSDKAGTLTFSADSNDLGKYGLTLSPKGILSGKLKNVPTNTHIISFNISVKNRLGGASHHFMLYETPKQLPITSLGAAPHWKSSTPKNLTIAYTGKAITDINLNQYISNEAKTGNITFTSSTLPEGLTLSSNGNLFGTPLEQESVDFTVTSKDQKGGKSTHQFHMQVAPGEIAQWTNNKNLTEAEGQQVNVNLNSDRYITNLSDIGYVTFKAADEGRLSQNGLKLSSSGLLTGKLTNNNGNLNFTVVAHTASGESKPETFSLHRQDPPPKLAWTGNQYLVERPGQPVDIDLDSSQYISNANTAGKITFTALQPGLLEDHGLRLSPQGFLTGTLKNAPSGNLNIYVSASNGSKSVEQTLILHRDKTIGQQPLQWINGGGLTEIKGQPINIDLNTSQYITNINGDGVVIFTALNPGKLKSHGLMLSPSGLLSGTLSNSPSGNFDFIVMASDGNGSVQKTFSLDRVNSLLQASSTQSVSGAAAAKTTKTTKGKGKAASKSKSKDKTKVKTTSKTNSKAKAKAKSTHPVAKKLDNKKPLPLKRADSVKGNGNGKGKSEQSQHTSIGSKIKQFINKHL